MNHNPTPGPAGSEFLYGHVWVTIIWLVKHPQWGCIGMPLLALMSVRQQDLQILERIGERIGNAPWKFRTELELAAEPVEWCVTLFKSWLLFGRVGGFLLYGPKCVAGNDYRKRGRSFVHRTEFP